MKNPSSSVRTLFASLVAILFSVSVCSGQELAKYRGFQLGSTTESVLAAIGMKPSDVRTIHTQPAVLEELEWNPQRSFAGQPIAESLRQIRFSFLNGELYKMIVGYDYLQTEGLTTEDVIDAVSSQFGKATVSNAATMVSVSSSVFDDQQRVLALWEDSEYAYSLFRSYVGSFGLVIVAKQRNSAADTAAAEAVIRERLEAPQKELDRRAQADQERLASQEKARLVNKPKFRP
jgi:hypothetical protein